MNATLPAHTDSRVLHLLLAHHLADTSPAPIAPRYQRELERGFTDRDWHTCPNCQGAGTRTWKRKTVACDHPKCRGNGGWAGDDYDLQRRHIKAEHAPELSVLEFARTAWTLLDDPDVGVWKVCNAVEQRARNYATERPERNPHPAYRQLEWAVDRLRSVDPDGFVAVGRRHRINDATVAPWSSVWEQRYREALTHIGRLLGPGFRAPRWARERALEHAAA